MSAFRDEFNGAYLPGVGYIIDPQPADYLSAIRYLEHPRFLWQGNLCDSMKATARRLEWSPSRMRATRRKTA